jgi:hypothetical protein
MTLLFTGCNKNVDEKNVAPSSSPIIQEEQKEEPKVSPKEEEPPVLITEDTST